MKVQDMMPNGFTYMMDEEKRLLQNVRKDPKKAQDLISDIDKLSWCPSEEFLLTAVFLCPMIIRKIDNQSFWLRAIAYVLDKNTSKYINCMTPAIRSKGNCKIKDLDMPPYLHRIYDNVCALQSGKSITTLLGKTL